MKTPIEKTKKDPLFATLDITEQKILDSFDEIIQGVQSLSSKQLRILPQNIRQLSHELTDERSLRKSGYMNEAARLSAYTRYFMWWNLVRLTSVFKALPEDMFNTISDGAYCLDLGSGPLTVPISLYLSRPELRNKKLTWYCVDTSQNALTLGENLLLSVMAQLPGQEWSIIRVKGEMGTSIKQPASLVTCANMFNELFWNTNKPLEELSKKYGTMLLQYGAKESVYFIAEPGIPRSARFVSLLRDFMLRKNYSIISPCTHSKKCPMDGRKGQKWCHFILDGSIAPKNLQKMSTSAGLTKDRASISFVCATSQKLEEEKSLSCRIVSDPIVLPFGEKKRKGRYACAPWGLTLAMEGKESYVSGDKIVYDISQDAIAKLPIDAKTKARVIL